MSEDSKFIESENKTKILKKIPWKIYISRALSAWGDRLWVRISMILCAWTKATSSTTAELN